MALRFWRGACTWLPWGRLQVARSSFERFKSPASYSAGTLPEERKKEETNIFIDIHKKIALVVEEEQNCKYEL